MVVRSNEWQQQQTSREFQTAASGAGRQQVRHISAVLFHARHQTGTRIGRHWLCYRLA